MSVDLIISKTQRALEEELRGIVNITAVHRRPDGWRVEAEVMEKKGGWQRRNECRCCNRYEILFDEAINIIGHYRIGVSGAAAADSQQPDAVCGELPVPDNPPADSAAMSAAPPFSGLPPAEIVPPDALEDEKGEEAEIAAEQVGGVDGIAETAVEVASGETKARQEDSMSEEFVSDGLSGEANESEVVGEALEEVVCPEETAGGTDNGERLEADPKEEAAPATGPDRAAEIALLTPEEEKIMEFLRDCPAGLTLEELRNLTGIRLNKLSLHLRRLSGRDCVQAKERRFTAAVL
ncbi:MAG: hypothetical protein ACOX8W_02635 [bacterium]